MSPVFLSLTSFVLAAGVFTLVPGLDTAFVLRSATTSGPRAGFSAAFGITLGLFIWGASAAFGLTALLAASKLAFTIVKWAGALYLFNVGIRLLLKPRTRLAPDSGGVSADDGLSGRRIAAQIGAFPSFRQGLVTNLLNPKVGIFFITFLPQFIPHGVNFVAFSLLLAAIQVMLTLSWFSLLIMMTVPLSAFLSRPRTVRMLDRLTGGVFMAFGLRLALERQG
ncbi:LysE family translocator [Asaia krungthepensis]|uniref:Amino acid efflux protein n=1 Tax=Asaia krungthepensis NRIC 0535 TaxID=1307925 RepID=A0ABQ0Q5M6_9PROT|nr:LysE family translocator [Asaia krungthepensis]GBQ92583.1 amino acid efflux protein [Asaia krungthepensis NRIC 0535]